MEKCSFLFVNNIRILEYLPAGRQDGVLERNMMLPFSNFPCLSIGWHGCYMGTALVPYTLTKKKKLPERQ
ncbi:MAG: hypothetical protein KAT68_12795 [Bacteroidales bacterium]|nr:hypothetical protein [Bacteroidales bacterium]